jgi:Notch-like protein
MDELVVVVDVNDCLRGHCGHHSDCVDGRSNYTCHCHPGFRDGGAALGPGALVPGLSPDPYCRTEIDECDSGPCQNGGTCTDLIDAYDCDCIFGFEVRGAP